MRKFVLPLLAGKALKPAIFWWHESPFHDSQLCHIVPHRGIRSFAHRLHNHILCELVAIQEGPQILQRL